MKVAALTYTVGVKHSFLPFFKKYRVSGHQNDELAGHVRMLLRLPDGALLIIPEVLKKTVKIYPDYEESKVEQAKLKARFSKQATKELEERLPEKKDINPHENGQ